MSTFSFKNSSERGLTLIEAIVVVSLSTLLMLVITSSIANIYQANSFAMAQSNEIDQARRGLQAWLVDAKRMNFADDGTFPLMEMEPHKMSFFSQLDDDDSMEFVEYYLDNKVLYKKVYEASGHPPVYDFSTPVRTEILSKFVQNLGEGVDTFSYFDNAGNQLTSATALLTDVRYFSIKVIVNTDPIRAPGEFLLQSGATPRNMKDNL